jgi:hypothetical protein
LLLTPQVVQTLKSLSSVDLLAVLGLALELLRAADTPMRLAALCEQDMIEAIGRGWANRDASIFSPFRRNARKFRSACRRLERRFGPGAAAVRNLPRDRACLSRGLFCCSLRAARGRSYTCAASGGAVISVGSNRVDESSSSSLASCAQNNRISRPWARFSSRRRVWLTSRVSLWVAISRW